MNKEIIKEFRDLYLTTTPDKDGLFTKSITFNWGKFEFNPTTSKKVEFYLTTKKAIEDFWLSKLEAQNQEIVKKITKGLVLSECELPGEGKKSRRKFYHLSPEDLEQLLK